MWRLVLAGTLLVLLACAPANERPLRGAVPGSQAPTPPGVPPTLSPSEALRQRALPSVVPAPAALPSPSAKPAASPQASPSVVAAAPIVRTIVPGANAHVPAGDRVTMSAVLVGRGADLASATLSVNGADTGAQIDKRSPRDWSIHASQNLATGTHTVKVLVRDARGTSGGFTWQFSVGAAEPTPGTNP